MKQRMITLTVPAGEYRSGSETWRDFANDLLNRVCRPCAWCKKPMVESLDEDRRHYCSKKCRQTAFRVRKRAGQIRAADHPMRICYADPPYPGKAKRYYQHEPNYAGEVDHAALIAELAAFDGWALSTSAEALRDILPLCPASARVCAWIKPNGASPRTYGLHNSWEPLIVKPARYVRPGVRDWLSAKPARRGGDLPGRKPLAFCAWLFQCLGMQKGDFLVDRYPGTGVVSKAWAHLSGGPDRMGE